MVCSLQYPKEAQIRHIRLHVIAFAIFALLPGIRPVGRRCEYFGTSSLDRHEIVETADLRYIAYRTGESQRAQAIVSKRRRISVRRFVSSELGMLPEFARCLQR